MNQQTAKVIQIKLVNMITADNDCESNIYEQPFTSQIYALLGYCESNANLYPQTK